MPAGRSMPAALRKMPKPVQDMVRRQCQGDWGRVTVEDGAFVVHNKSHAPAPPEPRKPRVVTLPPVLPKAQIEPPEPSGNGLRSRGEALEAQAPVKWQKAPAEPGFKPGLYMGMPVHRMAESLRRDGFLGRIKYHPEVLALNGVPWEDVESAARRPHRVELRPESGEKGYPVFLLARGDCQVIMGFQRRDQPTVIAVYWTHLLGHDDGTLQKGARGSGGAKKKEGNPKTPGDVVKRLSRLGVKTTMKAGTNRAVCTYKDQELGEITAEGACHSDLCESDWNRIQRKVAAIDRRK